MREEGETAENAENAEEEGEAAVSLHLPFASFAYSAVFFLLEAPINI
jgi:hypothetical protein